MKISNYLESDLIFFLKEDNRDDVLKRLVEELDKKGKLKDSKAFFNAIMEREKIVSTGVGMGIAIPHAKLSDYDNFFMAIAILEKRVEWNAIDDAKVRLVFMIGGPDDKQTEYLQILSSLTVALKDEERRKKILTLNSADAIIQLF